MMPVNHSRLTIMENLLHLVQLHLKDIVKIKAYSRTGSHYLTWRITKLHIYLYDCGENYASVTTLHSPHELYETLRKNIGENTREVVVKYSDNRKEIMYL